MSESALRRKKISKIWSKMTTIEQNELARLGMSEVRHYKANGTTVLNPLLVESKEEYENYLIKKYEKIN